MLKRLVKGLKYIIKGTPVKYVKAEISYLAPDKRLEGRKILITGGGRGLGLAMARKFVSEGADVLITGRNADTLAKAADETGCRWMAWDVNQVEAAAEMLAKAEAQLGGLDTLVNNAGISLHEKDIRDVSVEGFDIQLSTNLRGAYFLSRAFVEMVDEKKTEKADILFISSERGDYADDLPYGITKNAVNCLVKGLAKRFGNRHVRVNAVAPGVTATDMTGFDKDGNLYVGYNVTDRVYLPGEVAEVACFMLSDAARCISGQVLVCNEGKSVNAHWRQL